MNLFQRLTRRLAVQPDVEKLWVEFTPTGPDYRMEVTAPSPTALAVDSVLALRYLQALVDAGFATETGERYALTWEAAYRLLADPEQEEAVAHLGMPAMTSMTPVLTCNGTLEDPDFAIGIQGWHDGERLLRAVQPQGAAVRQGRAWSLLQEETYALLLALREFSQESERTPGTNRRYWGRLRALALAAGARLDQFLTFTVVLTPEKLHIHLQQAQVAETGVVEVQPWFAGAPANWIDEFDRVNTVPEQYRLQDGDTMVEVVITPAVRKVLRAVKLMPGRRVAGALAEKFVSNPFATLGEAASEVLDEGQFEQARRDAGLIFQRFMAHGVMDHDTVREAGVRVESLTEQVGESVVEAFATPEQLKQFVVRVETKLNTGLELCEWRGYRLQLLGDTREQLDTLKALYEAWVAPRIRITADTVLDLKRYAERVTGIGVQSAIVSPYIPKPDTDPWFPLQEETPEGVILTELDLGEGKKFELLVDKKVYRTLKDAVTKAEQAGKPFIDVPGVPNTVSTEVAKRMVQELESRFESQGTAPNNKKRKKDKPARQELLIRLNVGSIEYKESRAQALEWNTTITPRLPLALKPAVALKPHQHEGVAWMQHLLSKSPAYCRGAVLADDMGLGKTLQLLTVIAEALEASPNMDPVLVVAPVSLLENWKEEAEKFFQPGALPILTLYGDATRRLRVSEAEIEQSLLDRGFKLFLKGDWLGAHKIVLTTYESLRDLEFSLAAVSWSLMVCDEAQKIKNPAAMVTRAAKKQNVGFRIACTGTPVENSLADLWCLFDYVQPGLLGALNEFGAKYRRPIECETDEQKSRVEELRALIAPQILRRLKSEVADLPPKLPKPCMLEMSPFQKNLYAQALERYRLREVEDIASPIQNQLGLLQYLRKVCTDPRELGHRFDPQQSLEEVRMRNPKLNWLLETLSNVREADEKAIVFCEFREMQLMLAHYIEQVFGFKPDIINGDTAAAATANDSRQKKIHFFQQQPGFGVIVLSPVAVGFGVNVQAANHVIHFTRTWNPAKEDQATDRAYRIGQTRPVHVYYPVVRAPDFTTFDVKLDKLLAFKRHLAQDMLNGAGDISPHDFNDVVQVEDDIFDERILIDDADRLNPDYFEALVAALWKKKGFSYVWLTPQRGDAGVDTVAKTRQEGELVQAKSCRAEDGELGWEAIKDLAGGEPVYRQKFPGVQFKKVAVTNRSFNGTAHARAEAHGTLLIEREGLGRLLQTYRVTLRDLESFIVCPEQVS